MLNSSSFYLVNVRPKSKQQSRLCGHLCLPRGNYGIVHRFGCLVNEAEYTKGVHFNKLVILGLVMAAVAGVVLWYSAGLSVTQHLAPASKPITAGGREVPAGSAERAKAAGYYCPSWDARPGQVTSFICVKLDK